jgi:hypothetical protein
VARDEVNHEGLEFEGIKYDTSKCLRRDGAESRYQTEKVTTVIKTVTCEPGTRDVWDGSKGDLEVRGERIPHRNAILILGDEPERWSTMFTRT